MVLIIVGDVDPEETIQLVREHEDKRNMHEMPPITRKVIDEPTSVHTPYVETKMDIVQENQCWHISSSLILFLIKYA